MKNVICSLLVLLSILLTSCQNDNIGSLGQKFIDEIDCSADSNGEAIIDVAELTDFDWDRMIAIYVYASEKEIEEALGFKYTMPKGLTDVLIFLKDGKIVYKESFKSLFERPEKVYLFFEDPVSDYREYTPDDAKIFGRRFKYPYGDVPNTEWHYILELDSKELSES